MTAEGMNLEGVRRVLALQEENRQLKKKLDRLRDKIEAMEEAAEQADRSADILLRSQVRTIYRRDQ
jgi:DNA-binding transcriptional MerR regulator